MRNVYIEIIRQAPKTAAVKCWKTTTSWNWLYSKIWGQGQLVRSTVKPSKCFILHPTSIISKHWKSFRENLFMKVTFNISWQPVGASKNWFYFPFLTQVFHPWWCETCRVIQQCCVKESDIIKGSKHTLTILHIFRGSTPSNPTIYAPKIIINKCLKKTVGVHLVDVINCDKFWQYIQWFRFYRGGGQNSLSP